MKVVLLIGRRVLDFGEVGGTVKVISSGKIMWGMVVCSLLGKTMGHRVAVSRGTPVR